MGTSNIQGFLDQLHEDPEEAYRSVLALRESFKPTIFDAGSPSSEDPFLRAQQITLEILGECQDFTPLMTQADPGHGFGHLARDLLNALRLLSAGEFSPIETVVGFIGGVLHDIGTGFVARYEGKTTPLRHAEVTGLFLNQLFTRKSFGLSQAEMTGIVWAVMAHTHYLKPQTITWRGRSTTIEPYLDAVNGKPLRAIWLPRMIDRLECSGSETFPARHWLTLWKTHEDYSSGSGFYLVEFSEHVRPRLLPPGSASGKLSMLEHLRMFAESQTSSSPYGIHDSGRMVELRDEKRERLLEFIRTCIETDVPEKRNEAEIAIESALIDWQSYLQQIEPSPLGRNAAMQLTEMFRKLPFPDRFRWAAAFRVAMRDYAQWSSEVLKFLENRNDIVSVELPGIGDLRRLLS